MHGSVKVVVKHDGCGTMECPVEIVWAADSDGCQSLGQSNRYAFVTSQLMMLAHQTSSFLLCIFFSKRQAVGQGQPE